MPNLIKCGVKNVTIEGKFHIIARRVDNCYKTISETSNSLLYPWSKGINVIE